MSRITDEGTDVGAEASRYRSKPQEVEAVQWTGTHESANACIRFAGKQDNGHYRVLCEGLEEGDPQLWLWAGANGAQDYVTVPIGHWIVRKVGDLSDHWPVDPDYFAVKYEPVLAES